MLTLFFITNMEFADTFLLVVTSWVSQSSLIKTQKQPHGRKPASKPHSIGSRLPILGPISSWFTVSAAIPPTDTKEIL